MTKDLALLDGRLRLDVSNEPTILHVATELDVDTYEALSVALDCAVEVAAEKLILDLSECQFLCSRSYGRIEATAIKLRDRGTRLVVRGQPLTFDLISEYVGTYEFDTA